MHREGFQFYKPCKLLQPYIRYYWAFRSHRPMSALTVPVGCPQIIFHKRTPLYIPELDVEQARLTVSGQVDFPARLCTDGDTEMIVVVFRPQSMGVFLHLPVSLLYNREVPGYDLENRSLHELAERIFDCSDDALCVGLIEHWLLSQLATTIRRDGRYGSAETNLRRIDATVKRIFAEPRTSVAELASDACLGKKQFERVFDSFVGITPKAYAGIVRFHKALWYMQHRQDDRNYAQIALSSGYADQSHFIREFKRFTGHTPVSLSKSAYPYSDLFTDPA